MPGLPKDLINTPHRTAQSPSEHNAVEERRHSRFKELMSDRGCREKDKHASLFSLVEEEHQTEEENDNCSSGLAPSVLPFSQDASLSSMTGVAEITASREIDTLFEEIASAMIVMDSAQDRETTLFLDSAKFSASGLGGTRITIKEFSTSPKVFNIEIATHATALHIVEAHKSALIATFEEGKFPFSVHRLDTELQAERHSHQEDSQDPNEDQP